MTTLASKPVDESPACRARRRFTVMQWLMIALAVAGVATLLYLLPTRQWLTVAVRWTGDAGPWGIVAFIGIYIVLATAAFPVTPLNVAAGILFGTWIGFAAALAGSVGSAGASFLLSRHLLQTWFKRRLACNPRFEALVEGIEEEQWKMVLLTRLNPVLPASLKNYSFGLTHVEASVYLIGTTLALIPATFVLAYLGSAGHISVAEPQRQWGTLDIVLYSVGGLIAAVFIIALGWLGRRKMAQLEAAHARRHRPA